MKNTRTAAIEQDFPAWMVWVSQRNVFWGAVQRDRRSAGPRTIIADSEDELRAELGVLRAATEQGR
ncbi:hypothetical protein GCM10022254_68170 [Actinomadura meridiana]|uniref:Uncharacterized protein n=1 Tax=Actinomadura meridiana TaxID=559626 RepID=A0ABP8CM59_9ACTN